MESNTSETKDLNNLRAKINSSTIPPELVLRLEGMVERLSRMVGSSGYGVEYENTFKYIELTSSLPWASKTEDNLDIKKAKEILDKNHFGMDRVKERILDYMAVLNLTLGQKKRGQAVLCFVGLPGIGKTSVAHSIAQALNRKFIRLAFGGLGEVTQLRGLPRYLPGSEPGQIIKGLINAKCRNPVILLDEIDRVAEGGRAAVMGALLEILDPEQNNAFLDYFIDYPFDLSDVIFIASGNNTRGIATAVMDRLEIIEMPSYTDDEKKTIGRNYLLPKIIVVSGLTLGQVVIDDSLWPKIIRPLGFDAGIRTLERTIEGIVRKVARKILETGKRDEVYHLTDVNIKEYLPTW